MRASPVSTTLIALLAGWVVIDGDTIHSDGERYRLLGIDAPEIHHAQCDAERRLGQLAKRKLQALIESGDVQLSPDPPTDRDRYGRLLGHFLVNGEDVAYVLIREGYAMPWRGRREDWCTKASLARTIRLQQVDCAATSDTD